MDDEPVQNDDLPDATSSKEAKVQNDEETASTSESVTKAKRVISERCREMRLKKANSRRRKRDHMAKVNKRKKPTVQLTPEEIQSIWTFLLDEIQSKEPGREGRIRRGDVNTAALGIWISYNEKFNGIRSVSSLMAYYRAHCKKLHELPFLTMAEMLDLYFALEIPILKYLRPRFIEKFGAVIDNSGIVRSATDVLHWDFELSHGFGDHPVPFTPEEDRQLWTFINKKIRDGTGKVRKLGHMGHLTNDQIWKDFLVETRTERTRSSVLRHFQQDLLANIMEADMEMQTKIELLYGLNHPIDEKTLDIIEKHAEVELNWRGMIRYAKNDEFRLGQKISEQVEQGRMERQPRPTRRLLEYRAHLEEKMNILRNASPVVTKSEVQKLLGHSNNLVPRPHVNLPPRNPTPYQRPYGNRRMLGNSVRGQSEKMQPIGGTSNDPSTSAAGPEPYSDLLSKVGLKQEVDPTDNESLRRSPVRNVPWKGFGPYDPVILEAEVKQEIQEIVVKEEVVDPEWPLDQPAIPRNPIDPAVVAMTTVDELFNGIWDLMPTFYDQVREVASTMTAEEKQPYVTRMENIARMVRLNGKYALTPKAKRQIH